MRVLQIHKFFYPFAGPEAILFHTRDLLTARGHDVVDFAMEHPSNLESAYSGYFAPQRDYVDPTRPLSRRTRDALSSVYSVTVRRRLRRLLNDIRPDVAHMHSIYHQLTLSVVDELAHQGVPCVMQLHDYKIGCPAYQLYRAGQPCNLCTTGPVENVLLHRCIDGSLPASLLAAVEARLARGRGTYKKVNAYIASSAFGAQVAIDTGIDPDTVHVIPNFLPPGQIGDGKAALEERPRFLFSGRLEEVKGVREILAAYASGDPRLGTLVVAGAGGKLESEVQAAANTSDNVEYLGRLRRDQVLEQLRRSRAVLVPSRWHENNPMSLLEARAVGVPAVCTDMGGLPEMVDDGLDGFVVPSSNVAALSNAIRRLAENRKLAEDMGRRGYERLLRDNTADVHYEQLMSVYAKARAQATATAS